MDMKQINNWIKTIGIIALTIFPFQEGIAGNPQRAGQAGASELLIMFTPWFTLLVIFVFK